MSSSQGTVSCVICGKTLNTDVDRVGEVSCSLIDTDNEMLLHSRDRFFCEPHYKEEIEKFS